VQFPKLRQIETIKNALVVLPADIAEAETVIVDVAAEPSIRVLRPDSPRTDFAWLAVNRRPGSDLRDPVFQQRGSVQGAVLGIHRDLPAFGREDFQFRARRDGAGDLDLQHLLAVRSCFRSQNGRAALLVNDAAVERLDEAKLLCRFPGFRGGSVFSRVQGATNAVPSTRGESNST